jgi:hypothetical protein
MQRRKSHAVAAPFAFGLALSILAAAPIRAQSTGNVSISWTVSSAWSTGYQVDLVVANSAPWTIYDWRLDVDFAAPITSIWNASVAPLAPPRVRFAGTGASWDDGDLSPGETVVVGFIVGAAPGAVASNATLNDVPVSLNGVSPAPPPLAPAEAPPWPRRVSSPYVDATAWPPFDFVAAADVHGQRFFNLAFIVATSATNGAPSWGGYYPVDSGYLLPEINELRARGGDVMASFGGAAGVELAAAHPTASALEAAYQAAIDAYGLTHVDFDIEGAWLADAVTIQRRSIAIAGLQSAAAAEGRLLRVWLTLPVLPTGLTADGFNVVASALAHGVVLSGVNIMAMDYGASAAPNPAGQMGAYAIQAATAVHGQLLSLYAAAAAPLTPAAAWRLLGVTPMIGQNDVPGEIFTLADAAQLLAFADQNDLPLVSFWSMTRDQPCPGGPSPWASPSCHSLLDPPFSFTAAFRAYTVGVVEPFGVGLGSPSAPLLLGLGNLKGADVFTLSLTAAPPSAASVLVAGSSRVDTPLFGATLYPSPDLLVPFVTSPAGVWSLAVQWPATLPFATTLRLQTWHDSFALPFGFAASNGLLLRTP